MKITGNQLIYLIQVLEDSLDIQMGYDYSFKHKRDSRKNFHKQIISSLLTQETIDIHELDLSKLSDK